MTSFFSRLKTLWRLSGTQVVVWNEPQPSNTYQPLIVAQIKEKAMFITYEPVSPIKKITEENA